MKSLTQYLDNHAGELPDTIREVACFLEDQGENTAAELLRDEAVLLPHMQPPHEVVQSQLPLGR